ncbi:hypothetical protein BH09PSE2_BH09PSE2_23540 [soil metagenome]
MSLTPGRRIGAALCAVQGLVAVAAGAFGAHATSDAAVRELLRTGAQYQGLHALAGLVALIALPAAGRLGAAAGWLFCAGALLFGASLDALALGAPRVVGAITPLGGLAMMLGWLLLALAVARPTTRNPA